MTRAIRTLLNCQSWCRLFPQKARLEKKGMSARRAIRRGATALRGGERDRLYRADRRIALFGNTMYVVMPKRHARPSASTMVSVREEDSANPRGENARRQFRRGDCNFSRPLLFLSLRHTFFRYCFFPSMNYSSR